MQRVRVRMLMTVTVGHNPPWPVGSVQSVSEALARVMVRAGEAVYDGTVLDTTVAVGSAPLRVR